MLAVSGLRISEAIKLERQSVDFDQGLLAIRQSKFNKTRLVPLHISTREVFTEYAGRRDRLCSFYFEFPCPPNRGRFILRHWLVH